MKALALGIGLAGTVAIAGPAAAMPIKQVTSPGGIHAWLVEDHQTKVIALDFAIRCGAACDPADKRGLSMFTLGLLDEGAGSLDSGQYQGRLADLAASIDFNAGEDWLSGGVSTLVPSRDEVFDLLRLGLTEPRFDAPAVDRVRAEMNQLIEAQLEKPDAVAGHLFLQQEFPGHPYGAWVTGSKATVAKITTDDLRRFAKTRLGRDGLLVSVVGDIAEAQLGPLLDKTFGALPAHTGEAETVAEMVPAATASIVLAKRQNPQTVITFGQPGPCVHDKDYFAARLVLHILGGGAFTARLEQEVREKRGLAYGIGAQLADRLHACFIEGRAGTQNARVAETIEIVRQQWAKMRDDGPSEAELRDAKTYLNGSYTIGLDSSGAIAQRLLGLQEEGLGPDYFEERPKLINAVTIADAKRVAKALIDPSKLLFAVVGAPQGITPDKTVDGAE
jgi:zinc protease